jgi:DNA-binding NarL/FixJ family response regulator
MAFVVAGAVMGKRVLLADDHDVVRAGLRSILAEIPEVEVIAEAQNGREAVDLSRDLSPDVVLLDISMPDLNGFDAARKIVSLDPAPKVIAVSMHAEMHLVNEVLKAGASGYVLKSNAASELASALNAIFMGRMFLSPGVTGSIVEQYLRYELSLGSSPLAILSPREREVLQLLAEGKSSKEIATALHVSKKTIDAQRGQIMSKLRLRTVAELTKFAIREGLTSL